MIEQLLGLVLSLAILVGGMSLFIPAGPRKWLFKQLKSFCRTIGKTITQGIGGVFQLVKKLIITVHGLLKRMIYFMLTRESLPPRPRRRRRRPRRI